ncbi:MAG TPA: aspartate ammonia-lyase [Chloroflexi bacterium]|jgi:hypothetical protein|nr:aspartate ammonia-lyase [Chloroflexota bacterium]
MPGTSITRGNASQFFVAGELCRRGFSAVVTLGNTPNTDILCSNLEGTKFVHIQVKTYVPGIRTCSVGVKAEKFFGDNFFWVLGGIPLPESDRNFEYYIIPSRVMAENVKQRHSDWLKRPGRRGQPHNDNPVRGLLLPPRKSPYHWDISPYLNRWDLIEEKLN